MWYLLACAPDVLDRPAADVPARPRPAASGAVPLTGLSPTLALPPSARPGGAPVPDALSALSAFSWVEDKKKASVYGVPLPVAPDLLPSAARGTHTFGSAPPPGMVVQGPEGEAPFEWRARRPGSWGFDREHLLVGVPPGDPAPEAAAWSVTFPRATAVERAMNFADAGMDAEDFVRRTFTVGGISHAGWFLPAPASARVRLTLPDEAVLGFAPGLLPPAVASRARSDGATVVVRLTADGATEELSRTRVVDGTFAPVRLDLRRWAGREVELELATEPGRDNVLDYVLLEDPVVYPGRAHPRKFVLVFVDTLRADHLGFLGYPRDTSPHLDRWATTATVFSRARTIAPWTLPSARAVLTGSEPEAWAARTPVAARFSAAGFRTDAIVSNAFLSQPFGLERGWARFRYDHLAPPDALVEQALTRLAEWPDRDQLVLVHFMGPHLPWDEPWTERWRWAGARPAALDAPTRGRIGGFHAGDAAFDEVRDWVTARYDQNVRWTDDELATLLRAVGAEATVVLFADHGEELWDHDGFEHGHQFGEELLRVPLVVKSPGLPAGRSDAPVSLLDVAPTLLELAGLDPDPEATGRSLVPLAWGDDGAEASLRARPSGFGRPLYGPDGWGVIDGERKWTARDGRQTVFDLGSDPAEQADLAASTPLDPFVGALGEALGRPVHPVWRVVLHGDPWTSALTLTASHPDGLAAAWLAYDPRGRAAASPELADGRAVLTVPAGADLPAALYLQPAGDPTRAGGLAITLAGRQVAVAAAAPTDLVVTPTARAVPFLGGRDARYAFNVDLALVPEPSGTEVGGYHADVEAQLRELGYLE